MTINYKDIPYPDFVMGGLIDPEAFDLNNAVLLAGINETINTINKFLDSTTDGDSGADNISMTAIAPFISTKVQGVIEELVTKLTSTGGSTFVGVSPITGVTGTTVHAQLTSIKSQLATELSRIDALTTRMATAETGIANRYTKQEMDVKTTSLQGQITTNVTNIANRYTKAEVDSRVSGLQGQADRQAVDIANRYTKAEVDSKNGNMQAQINTNGANITTLNSRMDNHHHDDRYLTKSQLAPYLQGGDTVIRMEVFTIVTSNDGNGTFKYRNRYGVEKTGTIGGSGEQIFKLEDGEYLVAMNHMKATINDTLQRSVVSGGLVEVSPTFVGLVTPEGPGTEITIEYFQRIGVSGEHNIIYGPTTPPPTDGDTMWFKVVN